MSGTPPAIRSFSGAYGFLSNFHPSVVAFGDADYPTVEHAFQAAKTLAGEERERIRSAATPGAAKRLGRRVRRLIGTSA